jgi:hypothetical protein
MLTNKSTENERQPVQGKRNHPQKQKRKEKRMLEKKRYSIKLVLLLVAFFVAWLAMGHPTPAPAADFPKKPITLICIYDPGGTADLMVRPIADIVYKELGQRVVVVNKVGGAGTLGITELSKAQPDGYTIGMLTYGPMAISPHLRSLKNRINCSLFQITPASLLDELPSEAGQSYPCSIKFSGIKIFQKKVGEYF